MLVPASQRGTHLEKNPIELHTNSIQILEPFSHFPPADVFSRLTEVTDTFLLYLFSDFRGFPTYETYLD